MYGKIFESIYDGSLYGQWEAIVTFQQMIVLANQDGIVDITPPALAARTSIPLDIIQNGIETLESDDPYSRTDGENGKRIIRIDGHRPWGWKIVNYGYYSKMASRQEKLEADRERMRKKRTEEKISKKNRGVAKGRKGSQGVADVAHIDVDLDKDILSSKPDDSTFKKIVSYLNEKSGRDFKPTTKKTKNLIIARFNEGFTENDFFTVIDSQCQKWLNDPKMNQYIRPETLFGNKFEGYLQSKLTDHAPDHEYTGGDEIYAN
ncbi:conserved phage C-terminal domain-containing protein [Thermodesulfobacteriota bacterium]